MIQLKSDCLVFKIDDGEQIPCSAEWVTFELLGEGAQLVDPEVVRNASAAVLHYFKHELQRQFVSVGEFAIALEKVLRSFGLSVYADHSMQSQGGAVQPKMVESNLNELAAKAASQIVELDFYNHLRHELRAKLQESPNILRFHSLRDCVKKLKGAERWTRDCQHLHDHIVHFLRGCWETEPARHSCALMVV